MLRSSKKMASVSKLALSASLEKEENSVKKATTDNKSSFSAGGELPYYETVPSKAYKMVFALLDVDDLKLARSTCRKWHQEIFPLLEEKTFFSFVGLDTPTNLTKARELSTWLNVVPKDSFQWKMLKALYPKPEEALPIPVLIQWSSLRITDANYLELRQWVARIHTPNVSFLQLHNVRLNWAKYLLIFRELEGLSKIHDTSTSVDSGIWEEFEKGSVFNEKLTSATGYQAMYSPHSANYADLIYHSMKIKEIKIRRSRLEEVILFIKIFLGMECAALERLEISAEDCLKACAKTKKKNVRLQEPKTVLFAHLGAIMNRNRETLTSLRVSFRHSTIAGWFDQYTKEKYEDVDGVLYKPDLRDFILFMKHHRWHETISLHKLETLRLEFENKKIPTVEEIEYLTTFISSLRNLTTLSLSHFLLTSYNSLSMPLLLNRIESGLATPSTTTTKTKPLDVSVGISLRNSDTEELSQSSKDRDQLPGNLELFYGNVKSLIVTCHSHDMDVRWGQRQWPRKLWGHFYCRMGEGGVCIRWGDDGDIE
ncbi:hypothetical protein Fcan01_04138 [Folsomia candida]|uniref:F-box domain-containing protein n=1 Tax=Folsomia candida TaxID=158441 RepID=A0A226EQH8_FOLCA|nr:hypothetical protein Fcan01_04138 [Folsomia candida]